VRCMSYQHVMREWRRPIPSGPAARVCGGAHSRTVSPGGQSVPAGRVKVYHPSAERESTHAVIQVQVCWSCVLGFGAVLVLCSSPVMRQQSVRSYGDRVGARKSRRRQSEGLGSKPF
jgi:hypothetical protein